MTENEHYPTFQGYAGFEDDGAALPVHLTNGGGRRDYGPKGCAGIALLPAVVGALLLVLRGGRR